MFFSYDVMSLKICNNINRYTNRSSRLMMQISSGQRINSAADDPAGLAISEKMRAQIRGLDMASQNTQDYISLMQTADGTLNETHSILQRIRELIVSASNDTKTDEDRAHIQSEIDQLKKEIDSESKTTNFNTINLFDGSLDKTQKGLTMQIGANQGQTDVLYIDKMDTASLGIDGINVTGKTSEQISAMTDTVDKAISKVSSQRSSLGSKINVMEMHAEYLDSASENLQAAESRIRDTDIAKAMMELSKNEMLTQISYILLKRIDEDRRNILTLLYPDNNK